MSDEFDSRGIVLPTHRVVDEAGPLHRVDAVAHDGRQSGRDGRKPHDEQSAGRHTAPESEMRDDELTLSEAARKLIEQNRDKVPVEASLLDGERPPKPASHVLGTG